jgi:hypothetical protein
MSDDSMSDEEFEQRLRDALADPVPDDVVRISNELFTWRTIDAELADLEIADSDEPVGVRGGEATTLTFVIGDQVIEADVDTEENELVVDLGGDWASEVALWTPDGMAATGHIDAAGVARFQDQDLPTGPVQLVITRRSGGSVKTRWVTL